MTLTDKALWVIERNAGGDLSLATIAAACGASRSHLATAFGSATGWPVIRYLRGRRLSLAAESLATGAPDILAVALDAGYGSHEAFTRAFRDAFGLTPEQLRDRGSTAGLALIHPTGLRSQPAADPGSPRLVDAGRVRAVGLARRHGFDSLIGIPIQWQDFMARGDRIAHCCACPPSGFAYPADDAGTFEYVCAVEVDAVGPIPTGLIAIDLPPQRYAVFEHRAHVSSIFDSYAAIWSQVLPERGWAPAEGPAIERHLPAFDPATGDGGVAIWIPLAGRVEEADPADSADQADAVGSAVAARAGGSDLRGEPTSNQRTLAAYERYAPTYARNVATEPSPECRQALQSLVTALRPTTTISPQQPLAERTASGNTDGADGSAAVADVLEIGSGPGYDADYLETLGLTVRRTDATAAFRDWQAARGRRVEALDVTTDAIEGCYAGVLMLAVLQHLERDQVDAVLDRIARALTDNGSLLLSVPSGSDDGWEHGHSGDYRVVRWTPAQLDERLARAGFAVIREHASASASATGDDPWRWVLAVKVAGRQLGGGSLNAR